MQSGSRQSGHSSERTFRLRGPNPHRCGEHWVTLESGGRFCSVCMVIECPGCLAEVPFRIHATTAGEFLATAVVTVVPIVSEHHCPVPVPKAA